MPKKTEYCTLEPVYPNQAFIVFLFVLHHDQLLGLVPLDAVYLTPEEAAIGITETVHQMESTSGDIVIPEECLIIPITLETSYSLKKEYWENPSMTYDSQVRMKTFAPVIDYPTFYSVLITPFAFDDAADTWYFHAALPLINPVNAATIEQFMLTSDHVVEPRAKSAGIYSLGEKKRFNWKTNEIRPFNTQPSKLIKKGN